MCKSNEFEPKALICRIKLTSVMNYICWIDVCMLLNTTIHKLMNKRTNERLWQIHNKNLPKHIFCLFYIFNFNNLLFSRRRHHRSYVAAAGAGAGYHISKFDDAKAIIVIDIDLIFDVCYSVLLSICLPNKNAAYMRERFALCVCTRVCLCVCMCVFAKFAMWNVYRCGFGLDYN